MADQGDLPRALRFAVSQIQPGSTGPTRPMNAQDREWLNEVLGQVATNGGTPNGTDIRPQMGRNIPDVLDSLLQLIKKDEKGHMADAVKNELQHIAEEGELMDLADDGDRRNSVAPISELFTAAFERKIPMVASLCSILAELAQNSPECQEEAMKLLPKLLDVIRDSTGDPQAKTKAVYALSAILRGNPSPSVSRHLFTENDQDEGVVDVLVRLVTQKGEQESDQLRTKSAFLLSCLAETSHEVRHHLSRNHERTMREHQEENSNIKELVERTLKRIHTNRKEDGKAPLALAM